MERGKSTAFDQLEAHRISEGPMQPQGNIKEAADATSGTVDTKRRKKSTEDDESYNSLTLLLMRLFLKLSSSRMDK